MVGTPVESDWFCLEGLGGGDEVGRRECFNGRADKWGKPWSTSGLSQPREGSEWYSRRKPVSTGLQVLGTQVIYKGLGKSIEGDQPALGMFQTFPAGGYNGVVLAFNVLILITFYCYPVLQDTRKVSPRCFWAPRPLLQHGICLLWARDQWLLFFCSGVFI